MSSKQNTSIGGSSLLLGDVFGQDDFNIIGSNGRSIKINGIVPSDGGSGVPPVGDIDFIGNLNCNDVAGGGAKGIITAEKKISSGLGGIETTGNVDIKGNGNLTIEGNGNIDQQGTGKITSGAGGIESQGDIQTIGAHDLIIGKDIYFDGQDIYHRTFNPDAQLNYKDYKQLAGKNDANVFTGANQFNSNTTEFAAKVSVGTRDAQSELFTQNLALNSSGNIECKTLNNGTIIQCGNINCGNAGLNEVRARVFNTRTNEHNNPEGWTIYQQLPSNPAQILDRSLTFKGGEANAFVSILDSAHGIIPNIVLDPRTSALGGLIVANTYQVGPSIEGFKIEQPNTGADANNLLIKAGLNNGVTKFQNNAGTTDLLQIEEEAGTNDGMLRVPKIEFGTGNRNRIYNLQDGATNLNLNIQHASDSSEIVFQDNQQGEIMKVKKTEIELGTTIPIKFGGYSFRPQQYSLNKTITIAGNADTATFTNMIFNCRTDTVTNVNAGGSIPLYNAALEGFYKVTVTQTGLSSAGNFDTNDMIFDYVYRLSTQTQPDITITEPSYGYRKKPTNQARPTIEIDHLNTPIQSQPVFLLYSGQNSGETMPIEVRLTKLDF